MPQHSPVTPYAASPAPKREHVETMFNRIAPT